MSESGFISSLIIPLVSLSGLLGGIALYYLAREEVSAGRHYFVLVYRFIFILFSGFILYNLSFRSIPLTWLYFIISAMLFVADIIRSRSWFFVVHYLFFFAGYFLTDRLLMVAVIMYLYGLPVGTLLSMEMSGDE